MLCRPLLISLALLGAVLAENATTTAAPKTTTTPGAPKTTTTPGAPKTTTTPGAPNITTTAAPAPNSTTVAPTTSTLPTTSVEPTSSTEVPTSPMPTSSTPPTPVDPKHWTVPDSSTGIVCIIAEMDLTLMVPYNSSSNKKLTAHVPVPINSTVSGVCGTLNQTMRVEWMVENKTSSLEFTFSKNDTTKKYWINSIRGQIAVTSLFPNISGEAKMFELVHEKNEFETPLNSSYYCKPVSQFTAEIHGAPNVTARFSFKDLKVEAFHLSKETAFSQFVNCDNGQSPDLVPIVVGCALALLVIVVLIAYLVGRRQSLSSGYLSM